MNGVLNNLIDNTVQCWGCPVFDRLFRIVSTSAAAVYNKFVIACMILFCVLFAFFVINAVWKNMKSDSPDPWFTKSIRPVMINSLVALTLLGGGIMVPRLVSQVTFEPVATIATIYSQSMIKTTPDAVNAAVTYVPEPMDDTGFFRKDLRDSIILLMKTTITQFQAYMKLGIAVMDSAFTWSALLGIGALIKHIILFFVGLSLLWGFAKLFFRFCCYFADIIIAMTFFAFFFPVSLMMVSFKNADGVPSWMSGLGKNLGTGQIKKLINAIIALAAATITYTIIIVVLAKFFSVPGASTADLMDLILSGNVFAADLDETNLGAITLIQAVVLVYVLDFVYSQIPKVTQMVLNAFNVGSENGLSEELADNVMQLGENVVDNVKRGIKTIASGGKK
ncbi:MAG: hypothetical protein IJ560_01985 [Alphaproteobacteria bacterium]|nr:hypothetical protein [Alphaproteobacteria bacterium]